MIISSRSLYSSTRCWVLSLLGAAVFGSAAPLFATTYNVIGSYANWPTSWVPLPGLNDPDDGLAGAELDFVGDSANSGAYYASTSEYVFFRQRVDIDTVSLISVFSGAHFVLLDLVGQDYNTTTKTLQPGSDGYPDYGFSWDSKSNDNTKHGLEMMVRSTSATYWNGINMDDIDLDAGKKLANDINGSGRTTDGYIRVIDGQSTTAFGNTTYIDYAVKWSYLQTYTGLTSNQVWRVAFASIANATDHNNLTGDIAGGANPSSLATSGWIQRYSGSNALVGNRVWNDTDHDGVQDVGETGMTNVVVSLYSVVGATTNFVASTTTDASGNYSFQAAPGNYVLRVDAPNGYAFSPANVGSDREVDSDFGRNSHYSAPFPVNSGDYILAADAGLYYAPTLAVITSFSAFSREGEVFVAWQTAAEFDTIGYWIERFSNGVWVRINADEPVLAQMLNQGLASYELADSGALLGGTYTWRIVEIEGSGLENIYGPYTVKVDGAAQDFDSWAAGIEWNGAASGRDDDPDGDGLTNFEEFLAGTDPLNANSVLKITSLRSVATGLDVRWASVEGHAYTVEYKQSLSGSWLPVKTGIVATGAESSFVLPSANGGFFRIVLKAE